MAAWLPDINFWSHNYTMPYFLPLRIPNFVCLLLGLSMQSNMVEVYPMVTDREFLLLCLSVFLPSTFMCCAFVLRFFFWKGLPYEAFLILLASLLPCTAEGYILKSKEGVSKKTYCYSAMKNILEIFWQSLKRTFLTVNLKKYLWRKLHAQIVKVWTWILYRYL